MAARVADVIQIVMLSARAHALLRGSGSLILACFESRKNILELVHARVGEQQRGIVSGHQ